MNKNLNDPKYFNQVFKKYSLQYKQAQEEAMQSNPSESSSFFKLCEQYIDSFKVGVHSVSVAFADFPKIYQGLNPAHLSSGKAKPNAGEGLPVSYQLHNNILTIDATVGEKDGWADFTMLRGYLYTKDNDPVALSGQLVQIDEMNYQLIFDDFEFELNASDKLTLGYQNKNKLREILTVSIQQ